MKGSEDMPEVNKVIAELDALRKSMDKNQCYTCSHEFIETVKEFGSTILSDAIDLLREQTSVKPERDSLSGRIWLCGNCGEFVGFEDHDLMDPNEFDNYCRKCGKKVLWEKK